MTETHDEFLEFQRSCRDALGRRPVKDVLIRMDAGTPSGKAPALGPPPAAKAFKVEPRIPGESFELQDLDPGANFGAAYPKMDVGS